MKFQLRQCSLLAAAAFSAISNAVIQVDPLPQQINAGEIHEVKFSTDQNYTVHALLVRKMGYGWDPLVDVLGYKERGPGSHSFDWGVERPPYIKGMQVPPTSPGDGKLEWQEYAIWVQGAEVEDFGINTADASNWFKIIEDFDDRWEYRMPSWAICVDVAIGALALLAIVLCTCVLVRRKRRVALGRMDLGTQNMRETEYGGTYVDSKPPLIGQEGV